MRNKIFKEVQLKLNESLICNNKTDAIKLLEYWDQFGKTTYDRYQTECLLAKSHLIGIINQPSIFDRFIKIIDSVPKTIIYHTIIEVIKQLTIQ